MSAAGTTVVAGTTVAAGTAAGAGHTTALPSAAAAAGHAASLPFTGINAAWEIIAAAVCLGVGGAIWRLVPRRTA